MVVESTLAKLQHVLRLAEQPDDEVPPSYWGRIPEDLAEDESITLTVAEYQLMLQAIEEVQDDLRFEHMEQRQAKDAVWRFVCLATVHRDGRHVKWFAETYHRDPKHTICYFSLEHLAVKERFQLGGAIFMSADDPEVPTGRFVPFPSSSEGIVAVPVTGTSSKRMRRRAQAVAQHSLRLLRVGLREDRVIHNWQLRFRLGNAYAFGDGGEGWEIHDDAAFHVALDGHLRDLVIGQPLANLPPEPRNDLEKRANTALDWFDRARLATDSLNQTLCNFYALEALLGDRSEREKGLAITFRRTMLSLAVSGHFSSPGALFYLYDEVRSGAVHGETAPNVNARDYRNFDWNARQAFNEYLSFAKERGLTKRSQVRRELEAHSDAPRLLGWLREGDDRWLGYEPGAAPAKG